MKIPIFEEILIEDKDPQVLYEKIKESKVGKVPIFINLNDLKKDEKLDLIANLKNIFLELNLNPRFPYPFYLLTDKVSDDYFPQAQTIKELPDHFFKKVKRPNNKELQLLNKLGLKVEKIRNLDSNKIMEGIQDAAYPQKKLYQNTKELYFLELLHYKIFEFGKEKNKNGKKI